MMMMGEMAYHTPPPWAVFDEAADGLGYGLPVSGVSGGGAAADCSPYLLGEATLAALQRYLPSNDAYLDSDDGDLDAPVDAYSCDEFRMYEFKIRRCARGRSHDWTECPYAHLGEKARRRDPRKYHYSGVACPDFRKGSCRRGDACEFAHGVFECWLHPSRYRTQPCKDGTACRRRVCFFAHTPEQLRVLQQQSPRSGSAAMDSYDGSPMRRQAALEDFLPKSLMLPSPTSTLVTPPVSPPSESPPVSPSGGALRRASWPVAGSGMNEVLASLRQLQLTKAKSLPGPSWGVVGGGGLFGSPRAARMGSLPASPMRLGAGWMEGGYDDGEPEVRVESGRALRAKMFERLSKEAERPTAAASGGGASAPDLGWVSDLVM